jgi:hypothetical protein
MIAWWMLGTLIAGALINNATASPSPYYLGLNVSVQYGPSCQKDKYGGENCSTIPEEGIGLRLTTDPQHKAIVQKQSSASLQGTTFRGNIPGVFDVVFYGSTHHRYFSGEWRTPNLATLVQQPMRLFLLLCPNGHWVASVENPAESCADHSGNVLGWGPRGNSA